MNAATATRSPRPVKTVALLAAGALGAILGLVGGWTMAPQEEPPVVGSPATTNQACQQAIIKAYDAFEMQTQGLTIMAESVAGKNDTSAIDRLRELDPSLRDARHRFDAEAEACTKGQGQN